MTAKPSSDDFFRAMRAALHDPDFHTQDPDAAAFLSRITGRVTSATTVHPGNPLSSATLTVPTHYDFCNQCGIDVFSNPAVVFTDLLPEDVEVQCDCGHRSRLPRWLFF